MSGEGDESCERDVTKVPTGSEGSSQFHSGRDLLKGLIRLKCLMVKTTTKYEVRILVIKKEEL